MPVLVSNGKHYRTSLLTGSIREEQPPPYTRTVSAGRYEDVSRPYSRPFPRPYPRPYTRRGRANTAIRQAFHALSGPLVVPERLTAPMPWSADDDRVLRELRAAKVSWWRISMVLDGRPVAELKKRWIDIKVGRQNPRAMHGFRDPIYPRQIPRNAYELDGLEYDAQRPREAYELDDTRYDRCQPRGAYGMDNVRYEGPKDPAAYELEDDEDWYSDDESIEDYDRKERHVSFESSSEEDADDDEDDEPISRPSKTKKIYYIDDEFTVDEVLLLHQIAADWRRDRWDTISRQFNEKTGRNITSSQAKSVVEE